MYSSSTNGRCDNYPRYHWTAWIECVVSRKNKNTSPYRRNEVIKSGAVACWRRRKFVPCAMCAMCAMCHVCSSDTRMQLRQDAGFQPLPFGRFGCFLRIDLDLSLPPCPSPIRSPLEHVRVRVRVRVLGDSVHFLLDLVSLVLDDCTSQIAQEASTLVHLTGVSGATMTRCSSGILCRPIQNYREQGILRAKARVLCFAIVLPYLCIFSSAHSSISVSLAQDAWLEAA